jgi:hypothetical protein
VKHQLDSQGMFRECFVQYLDYMGSSESGSDVVKISFLFEGQDNALEEGVCLMQIRNESRLPEPGSNQVR